MMQTCFVNCTDACVGNSNLCPVLRNASHSLYNGVICKQTHLKLLRTNLTERTLLAVRPADFQEFGHEEERV
jgi:hypothetical protein